MKKHFTMICTLEDGRQARTDFDLDQGLDLPRLPVGVATEVRKQRLWDEYIALDAFTDGPNGPPLPPELANAEPAT